MVPGASVGVAVAVGGGALVENTAVVGVTVMFCAPPVANPVP